MTYAGEFNINGINTVRIPSVSGGVGSPTTLFGGILSGPLQYYTVSDNFYTIDSVNSILSSKLGNILNNNSAPSIKIDAALNIISTLYPKSINNYFYSFGTSSIFGSAAANTMYRASVASPTAWVNVGTAGNPYPMVYVDSSKVWLFGGRSLPSPSGSTSYSTIYSSLITSNPLSFTATSGGLSVARDGGSVVAIGSNLYIYGGYNSGTPATSILTSTTADPTTWATNAATTVGGNCATYNDGTYIYIFLQGAGSNTTLYRAPVSNPLSIASYGTAMPATINAPSVFADTSSGYLYLFNSASGVMKAPLSNLSSWSLVSSTMTTAVRSPHLLIDKTSNKIYSLGGYTGTTVGSISSTVQSASLDNPVEWATDSSITLPASIANGEIVKTRGYYHIIGGNGVTGSVYSAPVSNLSTWATTTGGPAFTGGRACFVGDHLFYFGGETSSVVTNRIYRASVDATNNDYAVGGWVTNVTSYFIALLPEALTRFSLIRAGGYIYLVGGLNSGYNPNPNIYRAQTSRLVTGTTNFIKVGTLSNPTSDASVVVINDYVYLVGGGVDASASVAPTNYISYSSMTDLANGNCAFTEENTGSGFAEAKTACINDQLYFLGGRTTATSTTIYKNMSSSRYSLALPNSLEGIGSIPVVDKYGSLGSYSSFQKTGMLPWLTYDSTSNLR